MARLTAPARPGRHFQYSEFIGRGGCSGLTVRQQLAVHDLCERFLDRLRDEFGRTEVVSGCRSPGHNASVGGAPGSFHMYGTHPGFAAADVTCSRGKPADWAEFLERLHPGGLGVYPTHVHVDNRSWRARW